MTKPFIRTFIATTITIGVLAAGPVGCATKTGTGALVGGLGGAGIGAAIGSGSGHAGRGALIGGAIGTIGGALVGNSMDQQDQKKAQAQADQQRYEQQQHQRYAESPRRSAPPGPAKSSAVTVDTVINWWNDGESEEDILDRIDRSKTVFRITAADEDRMRDEGVSDAIIKEMKRSGRQAAAE